LIRTLSWCRPRAPFFSL